MPNKWISIAVAFVALLGGVSAPLRAQAKVAIPDLSGNWGAAPHESNNSFSLTDPNGMKVGTPEDDTPYQPWALAKLKGERPEAGRNSTFLKPHSPDPDPTGWGESVGHY